VTSDRSDEQQEQSHARHVLTKRPKHPGSTAAGALRGEPETQAALADAGVVVPVSRPVAYLGGGDIGCSSIRIEEGSTESPEARPARVRSRALHSALLGPCCSEKQFPELLPSTEAGATKRTVLASKEATPPQGVRGEGRQKAWLLGVISRPA